MIKAVIVMTFVLRFAAGGDSRAGEFCVTRRRLARRKPRDNITASRTGLLRNLVAVV